MNFGPKLLVNTLLFLKLYMAASEAMEAVEATEAKNNFKNIF